MQLAFFGQGADKFDVWAKQLVGGFIERAGFEPLHRSVTALAARLQASPTHPDVRPGVGPPDVPLQMKQR